MQISLGEAKVEPFTPRRPELLAAAPGLEPKGEAQAEVAAIRAFHGRLVEAGLAHTYEAAHARLAIECSATAQARKKMLAEGRLPALPEPSQAAADQSYFDTASRLREGLEKVLKSYLRSDDPRKQRVYRLWAR